MELDETFDSFEEAAYVAEQFDGGFPAYVNNDFVVRVDNFLTREEAEVAAATYSYLHLVQHERPGAQLLGDGLPLPASPA